MTGASSRRLALAGITVLATVLAWPPTATGLVAAAPLAALLLTGLAPLRWWAITTASLMLPYFSWGVMRIVTEPDRRLAATGIAALAIVVFLAALDSMRRR